LLFSEQTATFENLPFDFDRHRISKYKLTEDAKKLEGRIEPLAALMTSALGLVVSNRPKRPSELDGKSDDEIKRSRDEENISWFLRQFSIRLLDIHLRDAPDMLHYFAPHMHDGMQHVISRADFKLYDKRAYDLICGVADKLGKTLAYDHLYRPLTNNWVQAFGRLDRYENEQEEMKAAKEIQAALIDTRHALDELIEHVRNNYLRIDIDETSRQAAKEYSKAIEG
jgi:hypothetical protein